jgi:outer membrane receptor protein involved in Fe transport
MFMVNDFRSRLMASSLLVGAAFVAQATQAQATPDTSAPGAAAPATPQSASANTNNEIVVTGSLIRNPNLTSSTPVLVTNRKEIELRQSNTAEDLLREIPGIVPAVGSAVNNGATGASTVNLRGLGDNRNLVLLDGMRVTPATLTGVTDLNIIPLALIERVDVLTGGASTTYGADAVSGVVNFVTRRNFAGFEADASEQLTQRGDGNVRRVDATTGANFDDGRGNVVLSIGYQKSDAVFEGDRSFSRESIASADGSVGGSSTTPQTTFNFGGGAGSQQLNGGTLVPAFTAYNFNPFNILQTPFKRYNIFAEGHYQVSDNIEVYTRGLYSRDTVDSIVAPSGSFGSTFDISLSNPYLPAGFAAQACGAGGANCTTSVATGVPEIDGVVLKRRTPELGNRVSRFETDYFDYNLGVRGDITSHIKFDVYGSYGQSRNTQTFGGYMDVKRLQQGLTLDAAGNCTDTSNGCVPIDIFGPSGSINAAQAAFLTVSSTTEIRTSLAQAHAGISGDFGVSSPMADNPISFAVGTEYRRYKATQTADLLAQAPGELGGSGSAVIPFSDKYSVVEGFAELNAPLVQDKPFFHDLTLDGGARYSHYKIFGTGNSFNTTTFKGGGVWEPVEGFKFRADYSHAVRAPNINELFSPVAVGLSNLFADPCAGSAPLNNANLAAVCVAQGAPANSLGTITNPSAAQPNVLNSGNVNLKPEKANTYTLGAVISPRNLLPGFSASVDYYHIRITHAISAPSAADSSALCFGNLTAASAASPACLAIHRDPTTGGLDGDQAGTGTGFPGMLSNNGTLLTNGIDLGVNYNRDLGAVKLGLSFNGNYTFKSKFLSTPGGIFRECVGYYSAGCGIGGGESIGSLLPKFEWSQRTTLGFGPATLSLLWRHIDKMKYEPRSLGDQIAAANSAGCADPAGADPDGCVINPEFRKIKAANYFDLTTQFVTTEHLTLTFEVENLLDRKPPVVGSDVGNTLYNSGNTYPSTYDALGRRFVATAKVNF